MTTCDYCGKSRGEIRHYSSKDKIGLIFQIAHIIEEKNPLQNLHTKCFEEVSKEVALAKNEREQQEIFLRG